MAGRLLIGVYIGSDTDRENRATRALILVREVIVGIAIALSNDTRESVRRESGFVQVLVLYRKCSGGILCGARYCRSPERF